MGVRELSLLLVVTALLQTGATQPMAPIEVGLRRTDRAALVDSLEAAQLRFYYMWGDAFRLTTPQSDMHTLPLEERALRAFRDVYAHCHGGHWDRHRFELPAEQVLGSSVGAFGVCPSWPLGGTLPHDERRQGVDAALSDLYRTPIRASRAELIAAFDSAAQRFPEDDWITGQRVRLLVNQRAFPEALQAARECLPARSWCSRLEGYVFATQGNLPAADSAFGRAFAAMTAEERCAASHVGALLPPERAVQYARHTCLQRDSIDRTFWWLANPMWSEGYNERLIEQNVRSILIALSTQLDRDERYDWRTVAGGSAFEQLVTRYGWPAYTNWSQHVDRGHSSFLAMKKSPANTMYTTFEYATNAFHATPAWTALLDPLNAKADNWAIADPGRPNRMVTYETNVLEKAVVDVAKRVSIWWPREHFAPRTPIVQLPEGQVAFLRRDSRVLVATATMMDDSALQASAGTAVRSALVITTGPDAIRTVRRGRGVIGSPLLLSGEIESGKALLGIEVDAAGGEEPVRARSRFGIQPPAPLAALPAGEVAVSDPVLLYPTREGEQVSNDPAAMLTRMRPHSRMRRGEPFGVYWESYNFAPEDTIHIAIWVERHSGKGILRQLSDALSITPDMNTPIAISWKEVGNSRGFAEIAARVPVIGRNIMLDTQSLVPGDYWLDIVVGRPGATSARSRRNLTITAP